MGLSLGKVRPRGRLESLARGAGLLSTLVREALAVPSRWGRGAGCAALRASAGEDRGCRVEPRRCARGGSYCRRGWVVRRRRRGCWSSWAERGIAAGLKGAGLRVGLLSAGEGSRALVLGWIAFSPFLVFLFSFLFQTSLKLFEFKFKFEFKP